MPTTLLNADVERKGQMIVRVKAVMLGRQALARANKGNILIPGTIARGNRMAQKATLPRRCLPKHSSLPQCLLLGLMCSALLLTTKHTGASSISRNKVLLKGVRSPDNAKRPPVPHVSVLNENKALIPNMVNTSRLMPYQAEPVIKVPARTASIAAPSSTSVSAAIAWVAPTPITYGTALSNDQLNATANVAGSFVYTPMAGSVLAGGGHTLTATFTPSDSHIGPAVQASSNILVKRAIPVITWASPPSIQQGVPLTGVQLNASANVPGVFTYTPAAGTVLPPGTQRITVAFSPTDVVDFSSVTKYRSINVRPTAPPPPGPIVTLNSSMTTQNLQDAINAAPQGATVAFQTGTYNITSQITLPCNNLALVGPVSSSPIAVLSASFTNSDIFTYDSGCANLGSVRYLQFVNTGAIYFRPGNYSNFLFEHNLVTHLPSGGVYTSESGLYFDGTLATSLTNIVIKFNTFGDSTSCSVVFATVLDQGGYCAGVVTAVGAITALTIEYNKFNHVEEGVHLNQLASYLVGSQNSVCVSCAIEYNDIVNHHRIAIEVQVSSPVNPVLVEHNSIEDPINSSWGTMGVSMACCQWGSILGQQGTSPGYIFDDNVMIATLPIGDKCPPIGVEFWGNGSQGSGSLVQGTFCNGYNWGYGGANWAVMNNYICGPGFQTDGGGYITNEEHQTNPPTMNNNTVGPECATLPSVAPTIALSAGTVADSWIVTLNDKGVNTGIWYTTDGSTPIPGSGSTQLYSAPFPISSALTVKAVGMWGSPNQPTSYPPGYGYGPSAVVAAATISAPGVKQQRSEGSPSSLVQTEGQNGMEDGSIAKVATLQSISITAPTPVMSIGQTLQMSAVATFSDGSARDVTTEMEWKSSDPRTMTIGSSGAVVVLAQGEVLLYGSYQKLQSSFLASSTLGKVEWSGPIVITRGGVYSGNWDSRDPRNPAVTIATEEPVIIQDSHIRSSSNLVQSEVKGADLTVRNSIGVAAGSGGEVQATGAFVDVTSPVRLDIESNYIENVRDGVMVRGYSGSRNEKGTLIIRGNRARNLGGLSSEGNSGRVRQNRQDSSSSHFAVFDNVKSVPGIEVGWNEIINYPSHSLVSEVINVYRSSGTPNQPLEIHDNYIQGAYPYRPAQDAYQGGGVKVDGDRDDTSQNASGFTFVHDNQVVDTVGHGIAFAAGHDNIAANNRVISNGLLLDGTKIVAQQVGLSSTDLSGDSISTNTMHDNLIGWACWTASCTDHEYRQDEYFPASPSDYGSNVILPAKQISREMEENEYLLWRNKTVTAGVAVGPSF